MPVIRTTTPVGLFQVFELGLLDIGGGFPIAYGGTMQPIRRAAVAHDGNKTLAMLRCKANESLAAILLRLGTAIATARASGQRVDEINRPGADRTYEY